MPFRHFRHLFGILPASPRCKFCYGPFDGRGAILMRLIGKRPSGLTPQLCNQCEAMARTIPGGAEIELTMLFADVRDSTSLAEWMSPLEYSQLINRFYIVGTEVLVDTRALVDRLVGDQVVGLYVPGFAGRKHAQLAVRAAKEFLRRTGHEEGNQRWVEVGIGIHTDVAFVGAVGTGGGATDITVLGDAPNTAARLSSSAAAGDILISSAAYSNLGPLDDNLETRILELKGKSEPVTVHVIKAS